MSALQDNINSIRNSLKDIRTKLNSKGAGIVEGDDLNTWDDKINDMPNVTGSGIGAGSPLSLRWVCAVDKMTLPIQDQDGNSFSTSLTIGQGSSPMNALLLSIAEELTVPSHYNSVSGFINSYSSEETPLKKLVVKGQTLTYISSLLQLKNLTNIIFEGDQAEITSYSMADRSGYPKRTLSMPNATKFYIQAGSSNSYYYLMDINAPKVTKLTSGGQQIPNSCYFFSDIAGTIKLDSLKDLTGGQSSSSWFVTVSGASNTQIWELPSLETYRGLTAWKWENGRGTTKVYIGKNLSTFSPMDASNTTQWVVDGHLEFHIPVGDSTTKTTLDTFASSHTGFTYIQDYDI